MGTHGLHPLARYGMDIRRRAVCAAAIIAAPAALVSAPHAFAADSGVSAHIARSLSGTGTSHLHLVKVEGSTLVEVGRVSGALVGTARAELDTGAVFKGTFTIRTSAGSITGHGRATPHGSGRYQSFSGWFLVSGGTGRYAHIKGRAGLYGVLDRRNDSVVIQTAGKLSY